MRIPRPRLLSNQTKLKDKQKIVIEEYIKNQFKINNQIYSVDELSVKYQIPLKDILKTIGEYNNSMSGLMGNYESYSVQLQALAQNIIFGGLEAQQYARNHMQILAQDQGQSYKPFISAEVTKAIQTFIHSTKNIADILKTVMPQTQGAQTNILVQGTPDSGTEKFGPTEALKLLEQSGPTDTRIDKSVQANLYQKYLLDEAPEVSMRYQENPEDVGADLNKILNTQIIEHDNRREIEYGIVVEEDNI